VNAGPNTLPAQKMIVAGAVGGCEFDVLDERWLQAV
jgi:hypothetical protein